MTFVPETTGALKTFDFRSLPVPAALQESLAVAFEKRTGPAGTVKATSTASKLFTLIKDFCSVVEQQSSPVSCAQALRPGHLDAYVLARPGSAATMMNLGSLKSFLTEVEGLSPEMLAKCAEWVPNRRAEITPRASYTRAEERAILAAARAQIRAAAERIRSTRHMIDRYRDGDPVLREDPWANEHWGLLEYAERTGDVPRETTSDDEATRPAAWVRPHGAVADLVGASHLTWQEAAAIAMLLVRLTGQNGSTIAAAPAAHHRPDGYGSSLRSAQVDLDKPRRGKKRYMTATLVDLPTWATAPSGEAELSARDELHTPFGVYMLALELTERTRAVTGHPQLLQYWRLKAGKGFDTLHKGHIADWGHNLGLLAGGKHGEPSDELPWLEVGPGRMRVTFMARERRPVAHEDATFADTYLRRDRTTIADYQAVVARVLEAEVAKARTAGPVPRITEADVRRADEEPEAVAAASGVSVQVLHEMLRGRADTVVAACADNEHGPVSPPGQPCRASFLMCLDCPCARAMPHHLVLQTLTFDMIASQQVAMPALRWAERLGRAHFQLGDILGQFSAQAVANARAQATDADRKLIERLLRRELDYR